MGTSFGNWPPVIGRRPKDLGVGEVRVLGEVLAILQGDDLGVFGPHHRAELVTPRFEGTR